MSMSIIISDHGAVDMDSGTMGIIVVSAPAWACRGVKVFACCERV